MRRITYHQQQATAYPAPTPAPSSTGALGDRIRAACYAGLGVGVMACVLLNGAYVVFWRPRVEVIGILILLSVITGGLFTCYLMVAWAIGTASRDWKVDTLERERRWMLEDDDRDWTREQAERAAQGSTRAPTADLSWVNRLALKLLERHYEGRPTTRAACTDEGICTQPQWNLINRVFKVAGFKKANTLKRIQTNSLVSIRPR